MKRIQKKQTASQWAGKQRGGSSAFCVLVLCLVLTIGTTVGAAVLGGSLSRFARRDSNVIPLVPQEESPKAVGLNSGSAKSSQNSAAVVAEAAAHGELRIYDAVQKWSSETQVDLFKESYNESGDETVKAGDGEKVIAPGTSNFYSFTLKNNGNIPLDYAVSLKVEPLTEGDTPIPLEWRLLDGERTAVSNWQEYGTQEETLKRAKLEVRRQDNYTLEWRWAFERDMDKRDTNLGNAAVERLLGAKATITVFAEQSADWDGKPVGPWWLPKTGDDFPLYTYLTIMAVSGCGLLLLFVLARRRKKNEDEKHGGKQGQNPPERTD